ncbi:phage baseplate protein [Erwinia persicina]|uniref:phage baseplate protein n=1 Tax=Erwinia persicina TaxID=55211 RepID=UPI00313E232C
MKAAYDLANRNVLNEIYPVGIVTWFAQNKNPNTLFPGTTWKYIGENRTIRLAKADGSDAFTTGGADAVSLSVANLPAHNHTFSGTTSSFDYGTKPTSTFDYGSKSTNSTGEHTHTISGRNKEGNKTQLSFISTTDASYITQTTTAAGAHIHTVAIGAHTHTVGIGAHTHTVSGTTASTGSGAALAITNSFIKLMGWYRSA